MASGRILKNGNRYSHSLRLLANLLIAGILGFILTGCGTTESAQDRGPSPERPDETEALSEEFINTLNETRSELDDVYTNEDEVPAYFLQSGSSGNNRNIGDPYTGYRVQIISTRSITTADSVAANFRSWADQYIIGYFPQADVIYDQPYYKVHVGNFQFQDRAVQFTQLIKMKFNDAWVVHARIDPQAVPTQPFNVVKE